jgi:dTMP kinase
VNRGLLLAFDGVDGAGKTTQATRLTARLRSVGHQVLETKEPTLGSFGEQIREQIALGKPAPAELELHWFTEDRRQHVAEVIEPALVSGTTVVCDRYFLSTVAYQGARGLDPFSILADCEAKFPLPDLAIVLDVDPRVGLARVRKRGNGRDPVFERLDRLKGASKIFRSVSRDYIALIDGAPSIETVENAVVEELRRRFHLRI